MNGGENGLLLGLPHGLLNLLLSLGYNEDSRHNLSDTSDEGAKRRQAIKNIALIPIDSFLCSMKLQTTQCGCRQVRLHAAQCGQCGHSVDNDKEVAWRTGLLFASPLQIPLVTLKRTLTKCCFAFLQAVSCPLPKRSFNLQNSRMGSYQCSQDQ